jgi:hypothetical protein
MTAPFVTGEGKFEAARSNFVEVLSVTDITTHYGY